MNKHVAIDHDQRLRALVDQATPGEDIVLTRDGKAVAKIVIGTTETDRTDAIAAMERIREIGAGISLGDGLRFEDLTHEGHKY
jgi:antitoxin (DNA-binding transcriptional repressor) of toxin-antitoxin stability system